MDTSDEEFYDDFAADVTSAEELERLLDEARQTNNVHLRRRSERLEASPSR